MINWQYTGIDKSGKSRKGKVLAASQEEGHAKVTALGITPTKVSKSQDISGPWENKAPSLKDRALFTQQLAQFLNGGNVNQTEALRTAGNSSTNKLLRLAVEDVVRQVDVGTPIEEAVADKKHAKVFDAVFVAFIRMGAVGGDIGQPVRELAEMYKWQLRTVGAVKKGLTLPAIIFIACILVTYFIMAKVVPTFMKILDGLNAELPPLTKIVKSISQTAANPVVTIGIILVIGGLTYAVSQYRKTPAGKRNIDRLILRLPVVGPLMRDFILARSSKALAVMMRSGIPLLDALNITSEVAANQIYREHYQEMRLMARAGDPMYTALSQYPKEFPDMYALQFRSSEEKQTLKETLQYLSEVYQDDVQSKVESLSAAIEPFLMIFLGTVVGVIVISVFMPMTTMMDALQK